MPTIVGTPDFQSTNVGAASISSASFTPASGEILVVKGISEDAGTTLSVSGGGLTWTQRVADTTVSHVAAYIWTATGAGSSMTVTVTKSGAGQHYSMVVERWSSAQLAGTPATVDTRGTGAPSTTLTTTAASSVVSWCNGDWAAQDPTGRTYNTTSATPTEDGLHDVSPSFYVGYYAYQTAASAGSQTLGITAPAGQTWTLLGIEVQDVPASIPWSPWNLNPLFLPNDPAGGLQPWLGTGADAVVQVALSDTGSASDTISVTATIPLTDSGVADDTFAVTATIPLSDTGTATEDSGVITATVPLTETGAASEALTVIVDLLASPDPLFLPDDLTGGVTPWLGSGFDPGTAITPIALSDAGSAADSLAVTVTVPLDDTASGTDTLSITATTPLSDTGTAADVLALTATLALTEAASALDALAIAGPVVYGRGRTGTGTAASGLIGTGTAASGLIGTGTTALGRPGGDI